MKSVVYSCVAGFAVSAPSRDVLEKFEQFRSTWGHTYVGTEYQKRAGYFEQNLEETERLQQMETGTAVYTHLGPFADSSPDEKMRRFGLALSSDLLEHVPFGPRLNHTLASSLDWVQKGAVNPIKNQGSCGSCWAFSTACNLEGTGFVSSGKLVSVSEQNIVDCDKQSDGCDGGLPSWALRWSAQNGGVASEQSYPYTARDGNCRRSVAKIVHNKGQQKISTDDGQIAQALATYGPLSIAVDANGFSGYSHGVLQNPSCSKTQLNHAINIVGYGSDRVPYWKIRNSWGTSWGEQGYIRLYRGDCSCGVCKQVVTATGVTVSGAPTPPGPSPPGPSPPPSCHDSSRWCPSSPNWECRWMVSSCLKSCGCCGGGKPSSYCPSPSPPGPSPTPPGPSPTPPGPAPCVTCEWNSQCPSGQDCYYSSSSASSGCCSASPPFKNDHDHDELTNQTVVV